MWLPSITGFGRSASGRARHPRAPAKPRRGLRLHLEQLEDRALPSSYSAATVSDLIADINAANAAGGTNTITLTAPTTAPYVLTARNNNTDGANGLPVIASKDILTIIGSGDTIDANQGPRLFDVAAGASLTLQNMTLQNGFTEGAGAAAEGGAIYNQGTLDLSAVTVQGCVAQGTAGTDGGDLLGHHGANISGIPGGPAAGGAIWSDGSLTLENGTLIQNNQAVGGNGGPGGQFIAGSPGGSAFGGGVYIAGGTANLTGVTINNNSVIPGQSGGGVPTPVGYGGGLYVANGKVNLSGDTVDGNTAGAGNPNLFGDGGGMYLAGGTVTLCNDTVQNNIAFFFGNSDIAIDKNAKVFNC
jgi:hypothetical protein